MIPKMSGPDVCRKIRKSQDIKETPIIMISAKSEEQDKVFGLDLGVDDYISKPYSIKELLQGASGNTKTYCRYCQ